MTHIEPSPPTTLQMSPGSHIPAGVIHYGCKCKALAVIPRHDSAWIVKRCGRVLRATGGRVDLHVLHGDLVGEHFNGRTTFPFPGVESLLRLMGHGACAIHVDTHPVKRTTSIRMERHRFDVPGGTDGKVTVCYLGEILIRGSELS